MDESLPTVSVIVPTYARPGLLVRCLEGLARIEYPSGRLEVIVADDASPMPLQPVIDRLDGRLRVTLITQKTRGGPGAARNVGATVATGAVLAFIDDDCVPAPGWLMAFAAQLRQTPDHLVGGRIVNALPDNPFSSTSEMITTYASQYYERGAGAERFFTANNLALPADRFRALGGFTTSIPSATAEDKEFCHRWRVNGAGMSYAPDAVVYHGHELTFRSFWRQHFRYGRGILCFRLMLRPVPCQGRWRPEPASFYLNLLRFAFAHGRGKRRWLYVGLMVLSQVATMVGALRAAVLDSRRLAPTQGRDSRRAEGV